ncbi:hypothetical protein E2C01_036808 [Portunus trituberculatus]|uniref:Uncharacterized protein n=1 Tax=Portunus trituberculatus TaxID=210409 RepID=A0A5B7F7P2_PORTR|nr:hypothetical protein [Portunus trituberculatus]
MKKPTAIVLVAERIPRCLGCMKTFVPLVAITMAEDKWQRILKKNKWENVGAKIGEDIKKLAAMVGEGCRVKVKVSDFAMEEEQCVLAVMRDLPECYIVKRGHHRDVSNSKEGGEGDGAAFGTVVEQPLHEEQDSDGYVLASDTEHDITVCLTFHDTPRLDHQALVIDCQALPVYVYETVVPLLGETVPVLASRVTQAMGLVTLSSHSVLLNKCMGASSVERCLTLGVPHCPQRGYGGTVLWRRS